MFKRIIYILAIFVIFGIPTMACPQYTNVKYDDIQYKFSPGDKVKFLKKADGYMDKWTAASTPQDKAFYLANAMRNYFMLAKVDKSSIEAQIGLGHVYDEMNADIYAKKHFFIAYNMDNKNPKLNYYFGNYYKKRNALVTAMEHYKVAYNSGYSNNYFLNYQIADTYEKLADIENAKKYYSRAQKLNPNATDLKNKIRLLEDLNYSGSQYYLFDK